MGKKSIKYKLLELGIKAANTKRQYNMPEEKLIEHIKTKHRAVDVPKFIYKKFDVRKETFKERPVFAIKPKNGCSKKIILFLHGGGGMVCPTILHYRMAADLVQGTGAELYFPFYPLGPEATVRQSVSWLEDLYAEIINRHDPSNITFVGDSAGAALCAWLCGNTESKPGGVVLISPAAGFDKPRDAEMKRAEEKDIMLSFKLVDIIEKFWCREVPLDCGIVNPQYVDYTNFPPTLLYYGTNEMFHVHIVDLIEKIKKSGTWLEVHKGEGLCHDWAIADIIPEGRKAIKEICDFVKRG